MIASKPPGLISRRTFPIDQGRWVLEEEWDICVPGCPMIRVPWLVSPLDPQGGKYIRQRVMSAEEYDEYKRNQKAAAP